MMDKQLRQQVAPINEQIGAIVHSSQQMEFAISFSLTLLKRLRSKLFDDQAFDESMDIFSAKTFGMLIQEFKKHFDLDDSAVSALKLALEERNFIIHRFFNENIEQLVTPEGRKKCLQRIRKARNNIRPGLSLLDSAVQFLMKESGMNPDEIMAEVGESIKI